MKLAIEFIDPATNQRVGWLSVNRLHAKEFKNALIDNLMFDNMDYCEHVFAEFKSRVVEVTEKYLENI